MLTSDQRSEFERFGLTRLPGAIAQSDVESMCERLWDALGNLYGIRREARETWAMPRPSGFQSLVRSGAFAPMACPVVLDVLNELLGQDTWQPPRRWGQALITFPGPEHSWDVPDKQWHLDFPASAAELALPAVRVFVPLSALLPGGGGTLAVAGSHLLVQHLAARAAATGWVRSAEARKLLMRADPWLRALWSADAIEDRVHRLMHDGALIDGIEVRVAEMTGAPGDVILMHPWLLHTAAPNCRTLPRLVVTQPVYRTSYLVCFAGEAATSAPMPASSTS